ncbi:MAG: PilZ domain-containing protein [Candidatus Sulfotelmatobacter sp.]
MKLSSLVLSSDEKIVRALRRTLGELEITVEHCADAEAALRKLTRDRFEAIIVDCADAGSGEVLRSARNAPCNKRAVAVAILDPVTGVRSAFDLGAHFVLYKPVSGERAKASFRAARALMKSERRRNLRVPIQIPVAIFNPDTGTHLKVNSIDLSEGGLAVKLSRSSKPTGRARVSFTLPGSSIGVESAAEFAWEGTGSQAGLRFLDLSPETARQLQEWLTRNSSDDEKADPPVRSQLTDLSLGGCYLEIASPFPVATRVTLSMSAAGTELRVQGVVRVMHPEKGMGVEFTQATAEHRTVLEKFLGVLTENRELLPELLVAPEGLETEDSASPKAANDSGADADDPLLQLFCCQPSLTSEAFQEELRKQRATPPGAAAAAHTSS